MARGRLGDWLRTLGDGEQDRVLRGLGLPADRVPVSERWRSRLIALQMQEGGQLVDVNEMLRVLGVLYGPFVAHIRQIELGA